MDVNFTKTFFVLISVATGALGLLLNTGEKYLPVFLTRTYRYGKCAVVTEHALVSKFEFPKRWFKHFYEFAAPASSFVLAMTILRYVYHSRVPKFFIFLLDLVMSGQRKALVTPETTLLALILLTIQCWKRLYETHRVSVFSDGKINISHYIIGFVHYAGALISLIGESEGFVVALPLIIDSFFSKKMDIKLGSTGVLRWNRITKLQITCAIIFLLASYEQFRSNIILSNLRKNARGEVVTKSHKIPRGRLFEYISAPLQFTEIIMYAMLSIIMWKSSTYHYVFIWVLANQIETGILTHQWYLEKFENYPSDRKIFIPYLL